MSAGIYSITNLVNGRVYIGSAASSFKERWRCHIRDLNGNKHHSGRLQNAWNKYGEDSFKFEIVEECSSNTCIEREQFYIDTLNPFYNICKIAGNCTGRKFSEESKLKMSESAKKRGLNKFLLEQQVSKAIFNEVGDKKCSRCCVFGPVNKFKRDSNICHSCLRLSQPSRKKPANELKNRVQLKAFTENASIEFQSMTEAERFFKNKGLKFNRHSLSSALKNNTEYYGYIWVRSVSA